MNKSDLCIIKSILQRIQELSKYSGWDDAESYSSDPTHSVDPYSTDSELPIAGPQRKKAKPGKRLPDYAYGQRGKNEAGRRKPAVTSLPSEAPRATGRWPIESDGYVNDNL